MNESELLKKGEAEKMLGKKVEITGLHQLDGFYPHRLNEFVGKKGHITNYWPIAWSDGSHSCTIKTKTFEKTFHRVLLKML